MNATWFPVDALLPLILAGVLGALVGWEREVSRKPAGLRTTILICVGAALFTELSVLVGGFSEMGDPSRISAQVVTGIGFLGAGAIIQSRGDVRGLTTAATIWVVAAIGVAAGAGSFGVAVGATALVLLILAPLGHAEDLIQRHRRSRHLRVRAADPSTLEAVLDRIEAAGLKPTDIAWKKDETTGAVAVSLLVEGPEKAFRTLREQVARTDAVDGFAVR